MYQIIQNCTGVSKFVTRKQFDFGILWEFAAYNQKIFSKQINVPFSIKRTLFKFFKSSLLNVPCDLKNGGLNNYKQGTYNREQRVPYVNLQMIKFPEKLL